MTRRRIHPSIHPTENTKKQIIRKNITTWLFWVELLLAADWWWDKNLEEPGNFMLGKHSCNRSWIAAKEAASSLLQGRAPVVTNRCNYTTKEKEKQKKKKNIKT